MTDIPLRLLDRTALPPSRAGAAKPALALADRTAEISLALAGAKFAGDIFNDVVASTAANEEAAFQGAVATEMEGFNTFVKSKPGASFEEIETERNKMIKRIEVAGQGATTRIAKRNNKNWMTRNKGLIFAKTQTQMEAIRARQALATFNAQRENLVSGFKRTELADLTQKQVDAGLLNADFAKAQLTDDFAVIDAAEQKALQSQAVSGLENNMVATAALSTWDDAILQISDPANLQLLTEAGMPLEDAKKILTNMKTFASSQKEIQADKIEVDQSNNTRDFIALIADSRVPVTEGDPEAPLPPSITELTDAFRAGKITETQYNGLVKRISKPDITTDRVKQAELYTKSIDIWRGTTTKAEFDKDLNASAADLDDSAYASLARSAADTLRSSQAEALSRANTEAGRLIVDFIQEDSFKQFIADSIKGLNPDAVTLFEDEANERRQVQFFALSRYNAEVRQWIEENPDKLGKDFFQFSESLKHDYWNKSIDDLRELRARTEAEFVAAGFLAANPLVPPVADSSIVTISTRAEYDKIQKGTRYRGPDGRIATKR